MCSKGYAFDAHVIGELDGAFTFGDFEFEDAFTFGDFEEQAMTSTLSEEEEEEEVSSTGSAATVCAKGNVERAFSFGDLEEQAVWLTDLVETGEIKRIGGIGTDAQMSFGDREWAWQLPCGSGNNALEAREGKDFQRSFTFGAVDEEALWPSMLAETQGAGCVDGSLSGSVVCGSGARAVRSLKKSSKPEPRNSCSTVMADAEPRRSVKPEPRVRPASALTVDVAKRRSV
eukprot:TRINITY_DN13822_c0_g1_i1.p1 TRINITY_DN13822_c0_g1~~TRINITY_DN13822_c0_g1_i1.p1  ORF type:complete len:230 (+),score=41.82 TRINITY_DN13822_c0_g1_i1:56-745(+)